MKKILLAALMVISLASFALADTLYLRDGRTIRGTLLGFANGRFVFREEARYQTKNVQVTLDANWVDSGVFVRRGERVQVTATGVITVGRLRITPDGVRASGLTAPLPNANVGELIGAIVNDSSAPVIELGSSREFTAD